MFSKCHFRSSPCWGTKLNSYYVSLVLGSVQPVPMQSCEVNTALTNCEIFYKTQWLFPPKLCATLQAPSGDFSCVWPTASSIILSVEYFFLKNCQRRIVSLTQALYHLHQMVKCIFRHHGKSPHRFALFFWNRGRHSPTTHLISCANNPYGQIMIQAIDIL